MDLTIEGKAYINGSFENCCLGIKDKKIVEIKKVLKADKHIKFPNKLILPAGIDMHVHFRDPGMMHKEDFSTGSLAAAFGGISCVFDMPNTNPQTVLLQHLEDKISSAKKKSFTDFGIYAGITNNNLSQIELLEKKASGFKIYLGETTNSLDFNFQNLPSVFSKLSQSNKPILFHAEDKACLKQLKSKEENLADHLKNRPAKCEEMAIKNILNYSNKTNSKIHICHLSSVEGLELIRNRTKNISIGATPHHLLLNIENSQKTDTYKKVNPPIRSNFDKESLFNALNQGIIDVLESDHAPHTKDEKDADFSESPSGIPGVETMYPMFLYFVKKDIFPIQRLISVMCEKPAEILDTPKGKIAKGMDADFIVTDLKKETKINSDNLHSKCGWSPFESRHAIFPEYVFIRGEKVIEENEIQVSQGFGKFVGE